MKLLKKWVWLYHLNLDKFTWVHVYHYVLETMASVAPDDAVWVLMNSYMADYFVIV